MTDRRGHKRIRGIAVRVVVFLLLGAVVNVGVAWGAVAWIEPSGYWHDMSADQTRTIELRHRTEDWLWNVEYAGSRRSGFARQGNHIYPTTHVESTFRCPRILDYRAGWPMLSLMNAKVYIPADTSRDYEPSIYLPATPSLHIEHGRPLPLGVVAPGFAINTLFYAVILWLLFAFPFTLRRWRRIRRGLCAKCAYPVGKSEVCTECGAQLRTKK